MRNDIDRLRISDADEADEQGRSLATPSLGAAVTVGQTTTKTSYPTTAGVFYYMTQCDFLGTETEGGPGTTVTITGANFYAYNLGTAAPPAGTKVICTFCGNRWVFRYDG